MFFVHVPITISDDVVRPAGLDCTLIGCQTFEEVRVFLNSLEEVRRIAGISVAMVGVPITVNDTSVHLDSRLKAICSGYRSTLSVYGRFPVAATTVHLDLTRVSCVEIRDVPL